MTTAEMYHWIGRQAEKRDATVASLVEMQTPLLRRKERILAPAILIEKERALEWYLSLFADEMDTIRQCEEILLQLIAEKVVK